MVGLKFWYLNIDCFNAYSVRPLPSSSVVIFTYASGVAFGEFSSNLNVFRLAACGLRMKRPEFYTSKAYSVILRDLLLCQGVGEQKK